MSGAALHHGYEPVAMRVVAGARWVARQQLELVWQFAFRDTVRIRFDGGTLTVDRAVNVNSGPLSRPPLVAHRQEAAA